jgi:hypothetical protein
MLDRYLDPVSVKVLQHHLHGSSIVLTLAWCHAFHSTALPSGTHDGINRSCMCMLDNCLQHCVAITIATVGPASLASRDLSHCLRPA